jgi:hypothetical protein
MLRRLLRRFAALHLAPPREDVAEPRVNAHEALLARQSAERKAYRAGCRPWNLSRPKAAGHRESIEYLLDVVGPDELAKRLKGRFAK